MANLRHRRLSPSGFEQDPGPRAPRWPWVAGVAALLLIALAWFDGGEEPMHPITQDVALPEQGQ